MNARFADIHQHILYAVDDGPETPKRAAHMLRMAVEDGIEHIIATPHVTPGRRPFHRDECLRKIERLNAYAEKRALPITVHEGAEIFYTDAAMRLLDRGEIPTLNGTGYVLVEFNPDVAYDRLFQSLLRLGNAGYTPVLAHAERYECLVRRPERAEEMKEQLQILIQLNCSAILTKPRLFHAKTPRFIEELLLSGIADFAATDAHDTEYRPVRMLKCYEYLEREYGRRYARRLTVLRAKNLFSLS